MSNGDSLRAKVLISIKTQRPNPDIYIYNPQETHTHYIYMVTDKRIKEQLCITLTQYIYTYNNPYNAIDLK